jgi:uncharacterized membrane protein YecN with MAPEG domain
MIKFSAVKKLWSVSSMHLLISASFDGIRKGNKMRTYFGDKKGFADKLSAECDQQF